MSYILHEFEEPQEKAVVAEYNNQISDLLWLEMRLRQFFMGQAQAITEKHRANGVIVEARTERNPDLTGFTLRVLAGENGVFSVVLLAELSTIITNTHPYVFTRVYRALNPKTGEVIVKDQPDQVVTHIEELLAYVAWVSETGQVLPTELPEPIHNRVVRQEEGMPDAVCFEWLINEPGNLSDPETIKEALWMTHILSDERIAEIASFYYVAEEPFGDNVLLEDPSYQLQPGESYYLCLVDNQRSRDLDSEWTLASNN